MRAALFQQLFLAEPKGDEKVARASVTEARRQDSDDAISVAIQRDAAADGRGVSAEAGPKRRGADQRDAVVSFQIFVGSERPSVDGVRSQDLQETRRHLRDPDALGPVAGLQRGGAGVVAPEALEEIGLAKIVELRHRERT